MCASFTFLSYAQFFKFFFPFFNFHVNSFFLLNNNGMFAQGKGFYSKGCNRTNLHLNSFKKEKMKSRENNVEH